MTANCFTGEFTDVFGNRFRYEGRNHDPNVMSDFRIRSLKDDAILEGSGASGATTDLLVFEDMCPNVVKADGLWINK